MERHTTPAIIPRRGTPRQQFPPFPRLPRWRVVKAALLHPKGVKMSDRQIAEYVGVGHVMVSRYRKELEATVSLEQSTTRTGRDGRTIDTANIGRTAARRAG